MSQTSQRRPSPRAADFKARFGFEPDSYFESRLQAARQRPLAAPPSPAQAEPPQRRPWGRYTLRATLLALVIGGTAGGSFLLGQGADQVTARLKSLFASSTAVAPAKHGPAKQQAAPPQAAAEQPEPVVAMTPQRAALDVPAAPAPAPAETVAALAPAPPPAPAPVVAPDLPTAPPPAIVAKPFEVAVAAPPAAAPAAMDSNASQPGTQFNDCESCPQMVVVTPALEGAPGLAVGRTEITFDDWARCVADGGCAAVPDDAGWGRNTRPVINVDYMTVTQQFVPWLSRKSGKDYRLPTAEEWDAAAMASAAGAPAGPETSCRSANLAALSGGAGTVATCDDGFASTAPVASLAPSALGLYDMRGNVWEWVSDCWTPGFTYKAKASETDCRRHMLRGGAWSSRRTADAAFPRGWESETRASNAIGFRIARSLP